MAPRKEESLSLYQRVLERTALGYSLLRSLNYTGQFLTLPVIERLATGIKKEALPNFPQSLLAAWADILKLLEKDSHNMAAGLYPFEVLRPETPTRHAWRLSRILRDGIKVAKRRAQKNSKDFQSVEPESLAELPPYARRNYHFQTGGYASEESAELYEHQVEILFSGSADAMRRLVIAPLRRQLKSQDGEGLHFLEIGAGTGRLSRFMKMAFPKARFVVSDMSPEYLKKAREQLQDFKRVDFVQAWGEKLPFQDQVFDVVYSCFLFHELPRETREEVLKESRRVLKPEGLLGVVDSIQTGDAPEFEWALQLFPQDFHEPFYKNYQIHPLEEALKKSGFALLEKDRGFLSKALVARKTGSTRGSAKPSKS